MPAEYELGRAMRTSRRQNDYRVRTREAAAIIGVPTDIDPAGIRLPSYREIHEARAASAMPNVGTKFNFGSFARGLLGEDWAGVLRTPTHALEAEGAIDVSFFRNITGQLLVTWVQQAYDNPQFIGDRVTETLNEPEPWNLGPHIVPKISSVEQGPKQLQPGEPYPMAQVIQDYVTYPALGKYGEIINFTLEAIGTDRTGQIGDSAAKLGYRSRYNKEVRQLAVMAGITITVDNTVINGNSFNWLGSSYNTYLTTGSNWINSKSGVSVAGNNYVIYSNLETLQGNILDPYSGIVIELPQNEMIAVVPYPIRYEHKNILKAEKVRVGPYATSGDNVLTDAPNPLDVDYDLVPSKILYQLLLNSGLSPTQAVNYFWIGAMKRAFKYRQYLPHSIIAAPPNNPMDFNQDIVQSIKTREGGTATVHDPRFSFQSYNN